MGACLLVSCTGVRVRVCLASLAAYAICLVPHRQGTQTNHPLFCAYMCVKDGPQQYSSLLGHIHTMRAIKSPAEIAVMQDAADIRCAAGVAQILNFHSLRVGQWRLFRNVSCTLLLTVFFALLLMLFFGVCWDVRGYLQLQGCR